MRYLINANALYLPLADDSIHCCVTSPPYYGLRLYTGIPPTVWGGIPDCSHEWDGTDVPVEEDQLREKAIKRSLSSTLGGGKETQHQASEAQMLANTLNGHYCTKCNAWLGLLGLEPTPQEFVDHLVMIFREVRRVLRPDGVCWVNLGDSYAGSGKGSGSGKQITNIGSTEAPRMGSFDGIKAKDLIGIPWMFAFAARADGWYLRCDNVWHKPNGMPGSQKDRPTRNHEYVFQLTKCAEYYFDLFPVRQPFKDPTDSQMRRIAKDPYGLGNSTKYATSGIGKDMRMMRGHPGGATLRSVWSIPTKGFAGEHFATFPETLPEKCIVMSTSARGACVKCNTPWKRITDRRDNRRDEARVRSKQRALACHRASGGVLSGGVEHSTLDGTADIEEITVGWIPGCDCYEEDFRKHFPKSKNRRKRERRDKWDGRLQRIASSVEIASWSTRPCRVLDCFSGTGTTLIAANKHGLDGIGIELNPKYIGISYKRVQNVQSMLPLDLGEILCQ